MEYINLGWSGTKVSKICLGTMSFGDPSLQLYGKGGWIVGREQALKILEKAWDLGINFFDTANVYSKGSSEKILGEFLFGRRDDAVIATKVYFPMSDKPNDRGLSRKHVMKQVKDSLLRLKTDYIDLYQMHRWDYETPIEETLSTFNNLVSEGFIRYYGLSAVFGWQLAMVYYLAMAKGWERPVSIQSLYNLLYREDEREVLPFAKMHRLTYLAYSPTAVGILTGKYFIGGKIVIPEDKESTPERLWSNSNYYAKSIYVGPPDNDEIMKRLIELAQEKGVKPSQIAIAWLLHKGVIPIIGTSKVEHLEELVEAIMIKLTDKEIDDLEKPYKPKPFVHAIPPPM
ncbi:putative oxidoreductase, aryl-alcohol dehydrogenase like protein [Caldisphaera lagunensis DSM 15908]|uniref:Putative oxidoreductase, aryl-alcohol dehydrogenase like protein n=1 Tax=Caldisphaera lagunensis (strain DSM 15908 / JCM 11604 / ANMR 0165 / IC-154) TaxID=1056495 RepID=L0A7S8_CALLD|nr:aldo/keto reductase [Caldisphaera lagunensis]AFZ69928.1 putative oxidoreductase, aryl-alcohol dehydrogenase like protein [Caldisphaera lagunensis DSM 15908]